MAAMARAYKRPCSICRRWFRPDARVGARQHTCSEPECQQKRRQRKQAQWRRRNPDYFVARRWATATEAGEPARAPPPLEEVPWDVVQSQMGIKAAVILGLFGRLLVLRLQSQMPGQVPVIAAGSPRLPPRRAQSQMEAKSRAPHPGLHDDGASGNSS
jgi:hypothetical protein